MKKVIVGISGGVDSGVAAYLLKKDYDVTGVTLTLCKNPSDDARAVCDSLGIPHIIYDASDVFSEKVIKNFMDEYSAARTPNPCVLCNFYLKFGVMLDIADSLGADYIATGHYSRLISHDGELFPAKALFGEKDQTYALCRLKQAALSRSLFPLGELSKAEVRKIAEEARLPVAAKKDSQDICFIPDGDYAAYIEERRGKFKKGRFIGPRGEDLGEHKGIIHYTVGQRRGLGIAYSERIFVSEINAETNEIRLGIDGAQSRTHIEASDFSFISDKKPPEKFSALAKIRYNSRPAKAEISVFGNRVVAEFEEPQRGVSPGQSLVIYDGERLLGGGFIEQG